MSKQIIENKTGHWNSVVDIDQKKYIGFIYRISSKKTGHFYIGKKLYFNKIGGKKKELWKYYSSSSKELKNMIAREGVENFSFLIVDQAENKTMLAYKELLLQIKMNAMFDPLCLNGILNIRLNKKGFKKPV